jgi:hypothetical protein
LLTFDSSLRGAFLLRHLLGLSLLCHFVLET